MRRITCLAQSILAAVASILAAIATPAAAQQVITYEVVTEEIVSETGSDRFVASGQAVLPKGIARFGPFRVLDTGRAALVDVTDERSPAAFTAMLAAYPALATLEMIECSGTMDDGANLRLGRMIRAKGIATHVPKGGSVRSGGVELFLAGARRMADPGAEFAVHAWEDEDGKEPGDFAADAPVNRAYLDYYREMGMSAIEARAFYDMTNSVANAEAKWLNAAQMGQWVRLDSAKVASSPALDSARTLR